MNVTSLRAGRNNISFDSEGTTLRGHLYLPETFNETRQYPAVIVTGSWTTVKEQMAGLYARRLAKHGYVTLAFDFRFYGESDGEPREYESPVSKTQDILNAFNYIETLPFVDQARVGALGVCASAGYMSDAVAQDGRVKALALVAPWMHDEELVREVYGGAEGVQRRTDEGNAARNKYEETGKVDYVPAASATNETAAMYGPLDYYLNPERGAIPEWHNRFAVLSWPEWLQYDGTRSASQISAPTLLVHSEDAAIPDGARKFYNNLTASKDFFWTEGTQLDFYDQEPNVSKAVEVTALHFDRTLDALGAEQPSSEPPASMSVSPGTNQQVVEAFFRALEEMDIEAFLALWADNGVQVMPFAPEGFPNRLEGKRAIRNQYGSLPENYTSMQFPREIIPTRDPSRLVVQYRGEIELKSGGHYDNTYVGLFSIEDGKIVRFEEYFNPIILQDAFGDALQTNFNVTRGQDTDE